MNEEIARRLREAAQAHQPDRARMLARIQRGVTGPAVRHRTPSRFRSLSRAALAGIASAGILATGGLAVAGIAVTSSSSDTVTAPPSPSPSGSPSESRPGSAPGTPSSRPVPVVPPPVTTRPTPSTTVQAQNGPLWSAGSVDPHSIVYWTQENLVLRTTQPLTALTVELGFAQTGGLQDTGDWQTLPSDDFTVTVQQSGGMLVYRWVLKPGRTVPAGEHEFAGQFNHATGVRSAAGDVYRVEAQGAGGSASVGGGFTPAR
ncbi:hypothetical protein OG455_04170 [Kitasatospora sp. NBC_01287]|uniref:hypothetical protein n=1 Tax=Kitasatospora sp. NBC_01287 TaxID=2903573 RepID=UPI002253BCD9|nr:hypothetical protein [Kitasatospora sp. NBC_01287]MCX4744725.1 hypothetical protein [Kitasatospora sp. NBC_01287]